MFYRCGFVLVLLLLLAPAVHAQPTLHRVGPPGGTVRALDITAVEPHKVYSVRSPLWSFSQPRLYKASGENLTGQHLGVSGGDVRVHPASSSIVFSGSRRSIDAGVTWHEMPGIERILAIHPEYPDSVWARGASGLHVSQDAGISWNWLSDIDISVLDLDAAGVLYGIIGGGVMRSHDGGLSWADTGFSFGEPLSLAVASQQSQLVVVGSSEGVVGSQEGGTNWSLLLESEDVIDVAIHPLAPERIYAVTGWSIYFSDSSGDTWEDRREGVRGWVHTLRIDPKLPDRVYAGTHFGGVFESLDGGLSWDRTLITPDSVHPHEIPFGASAIPIVISPQAPASIYFHSLTQGLLRLRSTENGWEKLDLALPPKSPFSLEGALATAIGHDGALYSTGFTTQIHALLRSEDDGETWERILEDTMIGAFFGPVVIHPEIPETLAWYLNAGGSIGITEDAFLNVKYQGGFYRVIDLQFVPGRSDLIFAATYLSETGSRSLLKTDDLGHTWTEVSKGYASGRLHVAPGEPPVIYTAWPGEAGGIFRSSVDEIAWEKLDLAPFVSEEEVEALHVVTASDDPHRLYAALEDGLYTSPDNGTSWEQLFDLPMYYLVSDPHAPGSLWAASYHEGVYRIEGLPVSTDPGPPQATYLTINAPYPNPSRGEVNVTLAAQAGSEVTVTVYDLLGRPVRSLAVPAAGAGEQVELAWDGRDDAGRRVPAGVYVIVAATATERTARMVMVLD